MPRIDIHLTVDGTNISQSQPVTITSGSRNYFYTIFKLSDHWKDVVPTAIFGNVGQTPYSVDTKKVEGDDLVYECVVPWEVLRNSNQFYVGLTGGDFLNTASLYLKITKGCLSSDDPTQDPIIDGDEEVY